MKNVKIKDFEGRTIKMVFHVLVYSDDKSKILIAGKDTNKTGYIKLVEDPQELYDLTYRDDFPKGELYRIEYVEA